VVRHLATVHQAMLWSLRQQVEARPFLGNRDAVLDYLRLAYGSDAFEEVRILYLDSRFCLLREERQGRGAPDQAIVSTAQVIGRALELGASGLVMVHNHPSGDPAPSQADKDLTRRMAGAAAALGMRLFDHVIVAEGGCYSFRGEGLL
jgi:DNA repair protein RadC